MGDYWGHVTGTVTFLAALAVVAWLYFGAVEHSMRELVVVGAGWLVLTVVLKFGVGHYVMGTGWARLLADYDLLAGQGWVFVLVALAVAPVIFCHYLRTGADAPRRPTPRRRPGRPERLRRSRTRRPSVSPERSCS